MPIAIDPNRTFTISLNVDKDAPSTSRPSFTFRYLTGRQWIALSQSIDRTDNRDKSVVEILNGLAEQLGRCIVGWSNMGTDFNADAILDVVNPAELYELANKVLEATTTGADDLKKSESPSPSSTVSAASTVSLAAA